ncbi:hypothetical protein [Sphaerotilus mobilis]|uniref:Metal binding Ada-like protein n=1 Tax=Sphaerotilus mobilis TaxID=47994 RepID=A0A4Q7LQJ0_9BURK|nr:hypothetical protein [Sphaerotilus mobilis]RZS57135.1 hypothetical protein EV685_1700 [Sphaerotilus mobilis]
MSQQKPPLQNRVDPWGVLHAVQARGTLMGNRGILHDDQNRIVRHWAGKAWLSCVLNPPFEQKRSPFSQGTYSELFFLDEATAFAAGHRPCRSCQRGRYDAFKAGWAAAHAASNPSADAPTWLPIAAIDAVLHAERIGPDRRKRTHPSALAGLPDGTFYAAEGEAWLVWRGQSLRWTFDGYQRADAPPAGDEVAVLTPPSIVTLLRSGFRPSVHPTANLYN